MPAIIISSLPSCLLWQSGPSRRGRPCQPDRIMEGAACDYSVASHNSLACTPVMRWAGSKLQRVRSVLIIRWSSLDWNTWMCLCSPYLDSTTFLRYAIPECGWHTSICVNLHIGMILWLHSEGMAPGITSDSRLPRKNKPTVGVWRRSVKAQLFWVFCLWIRTRGRKKACLGVEHGGDEVFVYGSEAKPTAAN